MGYERRFELDSLSTPQLSQQLWLGFSRVGFERMLEGVYDK